MFDQADIQTTVATGGGILVGYARVSTDDQDTALQTDALIKAGVQERHIYQENKSGKDMRNRPQLKECLRFLRTGDTLVVWKLDRLGRSVQDLAETITKLSNDGIGFKSLTDGIDLTTPAGKFMFHMLAAVAEFERNLISERTKAGMARAREDGRLKGKQFKLTPDQAAKLYRQMEMREFTGDTVNDIAAKFKISRSVVYAYHKQQREQQEVMEAAA